MALFNKLVTTASDHEPSPATLQGCRQRLEAALHTLIGLRLALSEAEPSINLQSRLLQVETQLRECQRELAMVETSASVHRAIRSISQSGPLVDKASLERLRLRRLADPAPSSDAAAEGRLVRDRLVSLTRPERKESDDAA
ncbi:hypothetical protein [Chitinimonas lacunae]|uniref:Uncharacterized protein n=1 Tax=Chitinimonas lacunae TaxID=1963018 RepID=A0ABV8MTT7_9NEIS